MSRVHPRKVKGFRDIDPESCALRSRILRAASRVYEAHGFELWDTPVLEYADCLGKYLPDLATVDQGVYSFRNPESEPRLNDAGREIRDDAGMVVMENPFLAMRYDLTAPLARLYAEKLLRDGTAQALGQGRPPLLRRYQYGPVYRFEAKLDPGRYREFWQLDFDSVGTDSPAADAEACQVLAEAMEAIGLPDGSYVVKVNNRKLLKGFLQSLGIEAEDQEQAILRVVDKLDKIGIRDLERELAAGRTDGQSGGAIEGLHLAQPLIDQIVGFLLSFFEADVPKARDQVLKRLATHAGGPGGNATFETGLRELETIHSLLHRLGIGEDRVQFDPTLVRGMAYYTGPVFEVVSRLEVTDAAGRGRRFGSICGGGRYDGLVEKLLGIAVPATGASIGVDRLAELLRLTGSNVTVPGPVLVAVLDRNLMADYQLLAQELRAAGLPAEVYIGSRMKLRDQLSYADARNCPVALLVGEDEMKDGVVTLRNLRLGKQLADQIQDKDAWRQKVQQKVPRTDIVPRVRELLI